MKILNASFWSRLARLSRLAKPDPRLFFLSIILVLVSSVFEAFSMGLLIPLLDIFIRGGDFSRLASMPVVGALVALVPAARIRHVFLLLVGTILLAVTLKNLLLFISEFAMSKFTRDAEHTLRVKIFERYMGFSKLFHDFNRLGDLSDLAINQVMKAFSAYQALHSLTMQVSLFLVYLGMMLYISWRLTLISAIMFPCFYFLIKFVAGRLAQASRHRVAIDQKMNSFVYDALSNVTLIHSCSNERAETERYRAISGVSSQNLQGIMKKLFFVQKTQDVLQTFAIALLILVCLTFFFRGQVHGPAIFLAFFVMLRRLSTAVGGMGLSFTELARYSSPVESILWIFDDAGKDSIRDGSEELGGFFREIRFEDVRVKLGNMDVLKGLNVSFRKGKMTALVGPTGSGKTTMTNLIPRFYDPTSGRVTIDGVELSRYKVKSLRRLIAVVDQQVSIFNTSIRENLVYGLDRPCTEEELDVAARQAHLRDFILGLPDKYDTLVGDRGVRLSGGERQRIAIARALLKKPEIFIFDEATSSLDMKTEKEIQLTLDTIARETTMIVVAHRISTVRNADHIVFVEDGVVREEGTFDQLLERKALFHDYWKLHVSL